jgi:hypothetical protein
MRLGVLRRSSQQLWSDLSDRLAEARALAGRLLSSVATQSRSIALWMGRSVRLGKSRRKNPLVFSLVARCQGDCRPEK